MKLAFTTLACPEWKLEKIVSKALECGYHGIDFRGYLDQVDLWKRPEFSEKLSDTAKMLRDAGLEAPCISTSIRAFAKSDTDRKKNLDELERSLEICSGLDSRMIRIFGGDFGNASRSEAAEKASEHMSEICKIASGADVLVAIETHDAWLKSCELRMILDLLDAKNAAVVWDVHHPYRLAGESFDVTWRNLSKWIKYTHFKDSALIDIEGRKKIKYVPMGEGDIPFGDCLRILYDGGYEGYLTFEWEKRWHPEIAPPELVIPSFAEYMRRHL